MGDEYSLKHVQFEVSSGLVDSKKYKPEFERGKQKHVKARLKMHRPTHQSLPNATRILTSKYRN